ncbi:MAG: acyl-CoA dehydrogenase family protein, partial [Candidatus Limnocylindria bacterium]
MDFELNENELAVQQLASELAGKYFSAEASTWRTRDEVPRHNIRRLVDAGLMSLTAPVELGGSGRPFLEGALAVEAVGRVCPITANFLHLANTGPVVFVATLGTEDQQRRFIPPIINGEKFVSVSITEPDAGSAATDLATKAQVDGDCAVINGAKTFCSNADISSFYVVMVRFGPGSQGIGALVVERETPGFAVGPTESFMSGEHYAPLYFDDARVPASNILAQEDAFSRLMTAYSIERCGAAAKCLGIAQLAIDKTLAYVNQRKQFGRRLSDFQGVQWMIAEMAMRLDHARLVTYRALRNIDAERYSAVECSISKVVASEAAVFITDRAIQVHGGYGISQEESL